MGNKQFGIPGEEHSARALTDKLAALDRRASLARVLMVRDGRRANSRAPEAPAEAPVDSAEKTEEVDSSVTDEGQETTPDA